MPLIDVIKVGSSDGLDDKMQALLHIARTVRREPRELTADDVAAAHAAGASDADVQLAVLIAAAFSMYNRMVEGFRARTLPSADAYRARAGRDRGARLQRPAGHLRAALARLGDTSASNSAPVTPARAAHG